MDSSLESASLSPYLSIPDQVAKRMLEIAGTGPDDVHFELGSGDGRVNFCAVEKFNVKKSVGVDIDSSLIKDSLKEKSTRLEDDNRISFVVADLMNFQHGIWSTMEDEATVVTMYFLTNGLDILKPQLEKLLLNEQCRVVTCGYPVPQWDPVLVEEKLGLPIHLYR